MTPDLFGPARIVPSTPAPEPEPLTCECGAPTVCLMPVNVPAPEWARWWAQHPYRALAGQSWRSRAAEANLARHERSGGQR